MAHTTPNDLEQIKNRVHDVIESTLAQTLGKIKAIQQVTQEIASTEREIRRRQAIAAQIEADLKADRSTDLESELEREKVGLQRLNRIHKGLISDLVELTNALSQS